MAVNRDNSHATATAAHRRARWVAVVALLAVILIVFGLMQLCSAPAVDPSDTPADSALMLKINDAGRRVDSLTQVIAADPARADLAAIPLIHAVMQADSAARSLGYKPLETLRATAAAAAAAARQSLEAQRVLYDDIDRLKDRCDVRLARLDSAEAVFSSHCKSFTSHAL